MGRYSLPNHLSVLELADELNKTRKHVISVLEKHRIIKWVNKRGKFILTGKGLQYGTMYDPSHKQFHHCYTKLQGGSTTFFSELAAS